MQCIGYFAVKLRKEDWQIIAVTRRFSLFITYQFGHETETQPDQQEEKLKEFSKQKAKRKE